MRSRLPPLKQLSESEKQRRDGRERLQKQLAGRVKKPTRVSTTHSIISGATVPAGLPPASGANNQCAPEPSSGTAQIAMRFNGEPQALWPQPWLHQVVDALLQTAASKELRLVLVWPGQMDPLALVHAMATLERFAVGDKQGLRALLYPATRVSFSSRAHTLIDRDQLLYWLHQYLTITKGARQPQQGRDNQNKDMMLMAIQSARNTNPNVPCPMLSEVLPHFDWDRTEKTWGHYGDKFLQRSRRALDRSHKRALFTKEQDGRITQLGNPESATDAVFAISHLASQRERREALKSGAFRGNRQPEVVLFDLTRSMYLRAERPLLKLLLDASKDLMDSWKSPYGMLIATDDPKLFFTARKALIERFGEEKVKVQTLINGSEGGGLSSAPHPRNWYPAQVSLKYFPVGIIDQEAAESAVKFWSLAEKLEASSEAGNQCRKTAAYLLRLANLPGGFCDFTSWMTSQAYTDVVHRDMSWVAHEYCLRSLCDSGAFAAHVEDARRSIDRGARLFESYSEATPLASRVAREIAKELVSGKSSVTVLFRFSSDIAVAQSFLSRYQYFKDGRPYADFADRVTLKNHRELPQILASEKIPSKLIFVGLPDDTLRILVVDERVPADSVVVVDYKRATDILIGLRGLRSIDTYKAYRGRIAGLADEIEKRLDALPRTIDLEKLSRVQVPRLSLSTAASEQSRSIEAPGSWRVELEGGRYASVGPRVYIYDPEDAGLFLNKSVEDLKAGDMIFLMSDSLKDLLESSLIAAGNPVIRGAGLAQIVRHYHQQILQNCKRIFGTIVGVALARRIHTRMVELDPSAMTVSLNRIRYWIDVDDSSSAGADVKPHSTRQKNDFVAFARALEIPENLIHHYWMMVSGHRVALQEAGRELADRYARVLFAEEGAESHYHLKRETILMLQREAAQNTFRLIRTIPPQ